MASPPTSFAEYWDRHARERAQRTALADRRRSLSWREASELSRAIARGLLALGIEPGAVVACWLPNWVESYVLRIACERAGFIWLPIAARLREWELQKILERSEPAALIVPDRFHDRDYVAEAQTLVPGLRKPPRLLVAVGALAARGMSLENVARVGSGPSAPLLPEHPPDDALVILPTSGSTGIPKFAQFRVSTWLLRARAQAELLDLGEDELVVALSQGLGPSIIPLFAAPIVGAAAILIDEFEPGLVIETLARVRPTIVCGVPPQIMTLLDHPGWSNAGVDRLRIWYTTGAAFPPDAAARVERRTPGIVLTGYGGMDFGGWTVPSPSDPPEVRRHTVGRPRGNTELRLVDDAGNDVAAGETGEIWGRGPCCAMGYFRDDAATREAWTADGWFRTGDLARHDVAGNVIIVGRRKDRIRRGGMSIEPGEIEALLSGHPKIDKAAVVGFPDPLLGERACAFVVPRNGEIVTLDELTGYLRAQRIATFKIPERLEVIAELPLRGDKIDRAALRRRIEEQVPGVATARANGS
jgi:non-ribosomal peptide synthetase component E (peptide arylation enzyme)